MYKKSNLDNILKNEGYYEIKEIGDKGVCGLFRFMFTTGLVIGIDEIGYEGRYCYSTERSYRCTKYLGWIRRSSWTMD